ncbi:MAG TPA: alpha/beta fold hydrolase [Pseudomonadales bacterium]|nr:alpha/beta fold hydrolase [Pseudomonadales bacterium]
MPTFKGNGIDICFEQTGSRTDPSVILIHGIGCQLCQWPATFVDGLAEQDLRIVRLDNRDVGLSAHLGELGPGDVMGAMAALGTGEPVPSAYGLADMADDVIALLDHLGLADAHIVGVSMGGMIAQHLAFSHGSRVRSMTSIMSSSGRPGLPAATPEAGAVLVTPPPANDRDSLIAHSRATWDVIGGPHHRSSEVGIGALAATTVDRMQYPEGFTRQLTAIVADGSRVERLDTIRVPSLVIHGEADPLVPVACGEDTAQAIPGAQLKLFPTMGHDLPEPLMPQLVEVIADFIKNVDAQRRAAEKEHVA